LGSAGYIKEFRNFTYMSNADGSIRITDYKWLKANITTVTLKDL
jgi:hypothetical protein